jgi:hypothetical protein
LAAILATGLGMMAWDVAAPSKDPFFRASRDLARRFWAEESAGAEVLCARTDQRMPLDPLRWQEDRAVAYLCQQAMYSPRHAAGKPPRLELVSETHPLRVVVFNETRGESAVVSRWIGANADRYALRERREYLLGQVYRQGKKASGDRYIVYELVPAGVGAGPDGAVARGSTRRYD